MESFYGGKQGFNFTLVRSFSSIEEMEDCFKQGSSYTDVNYGEYVIINTIDKTDKNNGSIYRRGYDYLRANGGAEYIGTVVGPAGPAPTVEIDSYNSVSQIENSIISSMSWNEGDLYPGNPNSQNNIYIASANITNENGDRTILKIGLKIPFPNFNFKGKLIEIEDYNEENLISKVEPSNPFYEEWKLNIPKPQLIEDFIIIGKRSEVQSSLDTLHEGGIWFEVEE